MAKRKSRSRSDRIFQLLAVALLIGGVVAIVIFFRGSYNLSAEDHFQLAGNHASNGQPLAAIIELKNALRLEPDHLPSRVQLGRLYLETGDGVTAQKEFEEAKRQGATDPELTTLIFRAQLLQGEYEKVLGALITTEASITPFEQWMLRGEAHLGLDNLESAREAFEHALELQPDSIAARRRLAQVAMFAGEAEPAKTYISATLQEAGDDIEALVIQGELEYHNRDFAASRQSFEKVVELSPEHLLARSGLARTLLAMGESEAAMKHSQYLIDANPNNPTGYFYKALAAGQRHDERTLTDALARVLSLAPDHPPSLLMASRVNMRNGQFNLAETQLLHYLEFVPHSHLAIKSLASLYLKRGEVDEAIRYIEEVARSEFRDAELLAMLGTAHMMKGEFDKANEYLQWAASLKPEATRIRTQLALSRIASGEPDEAIVELQSAVELNPEFKLAEYVLMFAHLKNRDFDAALDVGERLSAGDPENPIPINLIGRVYEAQGEVSKAKDVYQRALEVRPDYATASLNLARLEMASDPSKAKQRYTAVLAGNSNNPTALQALAAIAKREGNLVEAIDYLERARRAAPSVLAPKIYLMTEYLAQSRFEEAEGVVSEALAIDPKNPRLRTFKGQLAMALGDAKTAVAIFDELARDYPTVADTFYQLGKALVSQQRYDEAREAWEKSLALDATHANAKIALGRMAFFANRDEDAIAMAGRLQKEHPELWVGWALEADTLARRGQTTDAIALYESAVEKQAPSGVVALLATQHRNLGQSSQAQALVEDFLRAHPDDINLRLYQASVWQAEGFDERAGEAYAQVLALDTDNVIALNNLALIYKSDGQGVDYARRAYKLAPDNALVADTYGWLLVTRGTLMEGREVLDRALALAPTNASVRFHHASALAKTGEQGKAVKALESLLGSGEPFLERSDAERLLDDLRQLQ